MTICNLLALHTSSAGFRGLYIPLPPVDSEPVVSDRWWFAVEVRLMSMAIPGYTSTVGRTVGSLPKEVIEEGRYQEVGQGMGDYAYELGP